VEADDAELVGARGHRARDLDDRRRADRPPDRRVLPAHAGGRSEGLGDGLLGGEPRRQGRGRQVPLVGREQAGPQTRHALDGRQEPCDVDHVDPDSDDHAAPGAPVHVPVGTPDAPRRRRRRVRVTRP